MKNRKKRFHARRTARLGFTLTEVIVSSAIMAMVVGGMMSFYIQFYKMGFVNEQRNQINGDIRQLTAELSHAGRQANFFTIYNSIEASDRNDAADRKLDGSSGDMLVFAYSEPGATVYAPRLINKIITYYRDADEEQDGLGPVRRYEMEISPASSEPIESLLPSSQVLSAAKEVVQLSEGLADGRLFFNFWGRSIMVNGLIYHGNDAAWVTETYNFTISPRG